MTKVWLTSGMFQGEANASQMADRVVQELGDHAVTKSHSRHISASQARSFGLKIVNLEEDQLLQDAVLSAHHATILTLSMTPAIKIIENDSGIGSISTAQQIHSSVSSRF